MPTVKFQLRRDTAANWSSVNPVLGPGEPALETDTRRVKYGNGSTAWNSLPYSAAVTSVSGSGGSTGLTLTGGPITDSGTLTLGGTLEVANGGTGATSASAARANLSAVGLAGNETVAGNKTWTGSQAFQAAVTVGNGTGQAAFQFHAPAGFATNFDFRDSANGARWRMQKSTDAETGSNAGSNFILSRYNDSGNSFGGSALLTITRSNGALAYGGASMFSGAMTLGSTLQLKDYTVATLPTVGTSYRLCAVSDANSPTWNATLSGGGSTRCLAFDNGTNWTAH